MAIFFTSDTHFGDHRVLNLYPRPFGSVAEMDGMMVDRWNAAVSQDDDVWHLGDFARSSALAQQTLARLNGRKHLIIGNNDPSPQLGHGWSSIAPYAEMELNGVFLVLCHYPFRSWNRMARGAVNLHGHSHGRLKPMPRQHDVGVDVRQFRPVSLAEILPAQKPPRTRAPSPL